MTPDEKLRRERLGIPDGAERVLFFAEASHWDPNWLFTSDEYYRWRIRRILDGALRELAQEPRRIYSVECIFFLKMYWDRNPDKQTAIRDLVNAGRLRLYGSGVTTPDVIIPETEALLRDYLLGQEWLRRNGMTQEPRVAYFPDDFGMGAGLPSVLRALGVDYCAVTRIDGMHFGGSDYRPKKLYPFPGSSAETLLKTERTLDFVWRGPDGAEVLAHFCAFTYGQGDFIDLKGVWKWMGLRLGLTRRDPVHVARRIAGYVGQLAPFARTPYMFCPIGFDFVSPIRGLAGMLDRYNELTYPTTGVWATLAGFDDYLALVDCHRAKLPVLALDPNPYFMGFYASRPEMKQRCKRLAQKLIVAERLGLAAETQAGRETAATWEKELGPAWETLAVSNHHDYITGTAPDRVWRKEQRPCLVDGEALADRTLAKIVAACPTPPPAPDPTPPRWSLANGRLRVDGDFYSLEFDERVGGCLTNWVDRQSGRELLVGLGADLILYEDSGGLWRMGCEFRGGAWRELMSSSLGRATIRARETSGLLVVECESQIEGRVWLRRFWLRNDSPIVRLQTAAALGRRRSAAIRFAFDFRPQSLWMDVPGGVVNRPLHRHFEPTFWAAQNFAHVCAGDGWGLAAAFFAPGSIAANETGAVEWVIGRNATRERAFGFLPLAGHPARGVVDEEQTLDCAFWPTAAGGWRANRLPETAAQALRPSWIDPRQPNLGAAADALVVAQGAGASVAAVKRADRGDGWIVRLFAFGAEPAETRLTVADRPVFVAWRCDARERDLEPLIVENGSVRVPMHAGIETVRLLLAGGPN